MHNWKLKEKVGKYLDFYFQLFETLEFKIKFKCIIMIFEKNNKKNNPKILYAVHSTHLYNHLRHNSVKQLQKYILHTFLQWTARFIWNRIFLNFKRTTRLLNNRIDITYFSFFYTVAFRQAEWIRWCNEFEIHVFSQALVNIDLGKKCNLLWNENLFLFFSL